MRAVGKQGDWESRTEAKVPVCAEITERLGIAKGGFCVRTVYEFLADGTARMAQSGSLSLINQPHRAPERPAAGGEGSPMPD